MDPFSAQIQEWQLFFATVAGASATLMGLIFLSLSLNLDVIRKSNDESLRQIAWQTFANFFFLIMFAFVFLVPRQTSLGLSLPLLLICAVAIGITINRAIHSRMGGINMTKVLNESAPSLAAYLGLVVISIFILKGMMQSLIWLLPVVIILLAVAVRNAWSLLVSARQK